MWWLAIACSPMPSPDTPVVDIPSIPEPEGPPPEETGSLQADTGAAVVNLILNGDFEGLGGWEARLGLPASYVDAPQRLGRALFVDDPDFDVSWTWSAPVEVRPGEVYCLEADTWKTNPTNSGFPRVWVRFYGTPEAGVTDALTLDADYNVLDIDTSEQNRNGPDDAWVTVRQTIVVPDTVDARGLRVILTANASATGQLYWDDVVLVEGECGG